MRFLLIIHVNVCGSHAILNVCDMFGTVIVKKMKFSKSEFVSGTHQFLVYLYVKIVYITRMNECVSFM